MPPPPNFDDIDVAITVQVRDDAAADDLAALFADDDVSRSHAFGGADLVVVIAKLTGGTINKLIDFFAKRGAATSKASLKIGRTEIAFTGFTAEQIRETLASPHLLAAVEALKAK